MDLVDQLERVPERYRIDKRELGKVLMIASAAVFVVSVHSALTLNAAVEEVDKTDKQLSEMEAIIESDSFNRSMQALESTDTYEQVDIYAQFSTAVEAFNSANQGFDSLDNVSQGLENSYNTYQWLVLISLLGLVAGAVIIYI
jgi:hypothetical protein